MQYDTPLPYLDRFTYDLTLSNALYLLVQTSDFHAPKMSLGRRDSPVLAIAFSFPMDFMNGM